MNGDISKITLNLADEQVVHLFSEFITEKMRSNQISQRVLEDRVRFSAKTIQRYINGHMPSKIPSNTYLQFLQALEATDEEFQEFVALHLQENAEADIAASTPQPSASPPSRFRNFLYASLLGISLILLLAMMPWPNQASYYERGVLAKEQQQYAKAIDLFNLAIEENSQNTAPYYELADIYADQTNDDKAIKYYRKGMEKETEFSIRANNNLALLLLAKNDINNAIALLERALPQITAPSEKERWTQSGIILKNLAWAYWKMEVYHEAMKLITQAQQMLGPAQVLDQFPEVYCLHALIARHTGDPPSAEPLCIDRFKAYQAKQQSGELEYTIKPILGMTHELYLLVLNQRRNE